MLKSGSFDTYKNATTPMIVILGHLKLDIEIPNAGMETVGSNDCRRVFRKNKDANGVLAAM